MLERKLPSLSVEEFLTLPDEGDLKFELVRGHVLAFAGGTVAHGIIATRLVNVLSDAADDGCSVFTSDVALEIAAKATYVHPDVTYTCEELDPNAIRLYAPKLVVEVISPSTEHRDRIDKLDLYQSLQSIHEYLMVDSRFVWACLFRRTAGGPWTQTTYDESRDRVSLASFRAGCEFELGSLYEAMKRQSR